MCDKKKKNKKKKKKKKKTKKLSQFLKSHISGTREAISLKFGMWSAAVGGNVHSKNRLVSSRKHRATEVRKLRFLSSCQYTHGCYAPASWAARHTTVCLDMVQLVVAFGDQLSDDDDTKYSTHNWMCVVTGYTVFTNCDNVMHV